MEDYLGVIVEPHEVEGAKHDRLQEALYGFDETCFVTEEPGSYGRGMFDIVSYENFPDYWSSAASRNMFVAGDQEGAVNLISGMDLDSEEIAFERFTVDSWVEKPGTLQILRDEVMRTFPFYEGGSMVEEKLQDDVLEEMGVPDADVFLLDEVARPPEGSLYYSNTRV